MQKTCRLGICSVFIKCGARLGLIICLKESREPFRSSLWSGSKVGCTELLDSIIILPALQCISNTCADGGWYGDNKVSDTFTLVPLLHASAFLSLIGIHDCPPSAQRPGVYSRLVFCSATRYHRRSEPWKLFQPWDTILKSPPRHSVLLFSWLLPSCGLSSCWPH